MSAVTAFVSPQTQTSPIKQQNTIFDQSTPPRTKTFVDSATSPFEKSSSRSVNNVILPLTKEQSLFWLFSGLSHTSNSEDEAVMWQTDSDMQD